MPYHDDYRPYVEPIDITPSVGRDLLPTRDASGVTFAINSILGLLAAGGIWLLSIHVGKH
jgi:hypothetical protein